MNYELQNIFFFAPVFTQNSLEKACFSRKVKKNEDFCKKKSQNVLQIQINILPLHSQNGKVP